MLGILCDKEMVASPPPLGVMHPKICMKISVIALICVCTVHTLQLFFWRVVTGSSIRTLCRSRVTIMFGVSGWCVCGFVYFPCLTKICTVHTEKLERAYVSEGVHCISASPPLNHHWSPLTRDGLPEAKGRVSCQQLSADCVIIRPVLSLS